MANNGLWNPTKRDTAHIAAGERKARLHYLRQTLTSSLCPYCKRDILMTKGGEKFYTLGGSDHKCKKMREAG